MRPYLVLCAVVMISVLAFGQHVMGPPPQIYGPCILGCGPFVPLVTTPMVSLVTVSPNSVGASNATAGLYAGATNSTLSQIPASTGSVYTEAVWYQGGDAPRTTPNIHLWPEPAGHDMRAMHAIHMEHGAGEAAHEPWVYFSGTEYTVNAVNASAAAKGGKKATHSYNNADVERQNQTNGEVKYKGKTEKM